MNQSTPESVALAIQVYRWLLYLYPRAFRQRFGREMTQVFRVTCRASWRQGGAWEVLALALATASDVAVTATKERLAIGRIAWENMMATSLWARLGDVVAAGAIVLCVSLIVFGPLGAPGSYSSWLSWDHVIIGAQLLSRLMILVVIAAALRIQRTWMGRLCGGVALTAIGLRALLVDVWLIMPKQLIIPLQDWRPQLFSFSASTEGLLAALGLLGGIGLVVTTIRNRELEGWSSTPLRWQWRSFLGGSAGALVAFVARPHTDLGSVLLVLALFIVLPTWAYFAGTALGMLRSSLRAREPQCASAG